MPDDRRPAQATAPPAAAPDAAPLPAPPKLIEVELKRRYCPNYLVGDDGSVQQQNAQSDRPLTAIAPGIMKLHQDDAAIVLRCGVAVPTGNTWKDM